MKICFASNNPKKLEEISAKLKGSSIELITLGETGITEDLDETGNTLHHNAMQKAQYVFDSKGIYCFADDSGLEVEALNGEPGVDSAHYAGPQRNPDDNMEKLLNELEGNENRNASFKTIIALIHSTGKYYFEGEIKGIITQEKRGNKGFGYDPIFIPDGYDMTFAEMEADMKNKISHRALAVEKLIEFLMLSA